MLSKYYKDKLRMIHSVNGLHRDNKGTNVLTEIHNDYFCTIRISWFKEINEGKYKC